MVRPAAEEDRSISASLIWEEGGVPFSKRFGDVYFSAGDGLAETRHVFLAGNGLPDAWAGRDDFTIGETGFGTGLNFCAVADLWRQTRKPGALLHYLSIEGFPLAAGECLRALDRWPEIGDVARLLAERYPDPVPGLHRIHFEEWGIMLTLAVGEAGALLPQLLARVDAWFLDGFAPSRNPEMWRDEVLSGIGRLTAPGGTLATFTSAGAVRRGLAAAGFEVSKISGYGRKREMSVARKDANAPADSCGLARLAAPVAERNREARIAVVGGGIAGASLIRALRRRGVSPEFFDAGGVGSGASGNPLALVMPRMDAGDSPAARFHAAAYRYAVDQYRRSDAWDPTGVLVMLAEDAARVRAEKARGHAWHPAGRADLLDAAAASGIAGVPLDCPGLFHADAGLLQTETLLRDWVSGTQCVTRRVAEIARTGGGMRLLDERGEVLGEADTVILSAGIANAGFSASGWLPLAPVRGQLSLIPASGQNDPLKCALSWGGYLSPVRGGVHLLGATHDPVNRIGAGWEDAVTETDHLRNRTNLPSCLAGWIGAPDGTWAGRARLRAVTPDRVPLFGAVPDRADLRSAYAKRTSRGEPQLPASDILVLGGLGSRGFVTAPLAAEVLVARLFSEVWPLERATGLAGDPVRFVDRAYRRGRLKAFLG
ncbi:FAD-dependent 5-carboxymethylaminomethyl-2-thiouridine(34) oxidoreductase MnmC [Nisaea sp.]|uniref:FAD-dependent 5-carboxymethylaminomethyl-2-thiouridine(34) oxidoreductase MnmC n=1 Tax=Nisaea sp. TaxID=2024842 RepID=UPI003B523044